MTSDCLSRLEDDEQTGFSEDIIRDVSGNMFDGELLLSPSTCTGVPQSWSQLEFRQYVDVGDTIGFSHHFLDTDFRRSQPCRHSS